MLFHQSLSALLQDSEGLIRPSCFYFPYTHTGVFGIYLIIPTFNVRKNIEKVCRAFHSAASEKVDSDALKRAISLAKFELSLSQASLSSVLFNAAIDLCNHNRLSSLDEQLLALDSITIEDIDSV